MGLGYPTTCIYQFIFDQDYSNNTKIIQYFTMHGLVLFIKSNGFVEHMFYAWSFSHNIAVPIYIKQNKYFLSFMAYTTVFAWGAVNLN